LPAKWKEIPVSNAKSGNYCQPRCDEATTEVSFGDPEQGSFQLIIIPTTKLLIAKKNPSLQDVGSANGILAAISPAITGSVAIEEEDVVDIKQVQRNGRLHYEYELLTPYAQLGPHNLTSVCTSKNYLVIATISANEKQWLSAEEVRFMPSEALKILTQSRFYERSLVRLQWNARCPKFDLSQH
jgi:hypothetical protein